VSGRSVERERNGPKKPELKRALQHVEEQRLLRVLHSGAGTQPRLKAHNSRIACNISAPIQCWTRWPDGAIRNAL
jgi:hypothetical protein